MQQKVLINRKFWLPSNLLPVDFIEIITFADVSNLTLHSGKTIKSPISRADFVVLLTHAHIFFLRKPPYMTVRLEDASICTLSEVVRFLNSRNRVRFAFVFSITNCRQLFSPFLMIKLRHNMVRRLWIHSHSAGRECSM